MKTTLIASMFAATLLMALGCATTPESHQVESQAGPFRQDRFAIGLWVDPPVDEQADRRYAELAGANFTMVIGGFGAHDADTVQRQLELCEKYDLKAIVYARGLPPDELPDGPACWGYSVLDEPNAKDFARVGKRVDQIRRARPDKLAFVNLFPNYANASQLGTDTYEEYVARFMDEVRPDVLSMDHYPLFRPDEDDAFDASLYDLDEDGRDIYCANLEIMRKHALDKTIPFWNFFNIMPWGPYTDPTEAQVRWQVYTSIAYGAKGIMYFCYYTPVGDLFPKGGAIISRDDRRTNHYYQARRTNEQVKSLGPTLMELTSTGVYRIGPNDNAAEVLDGSPITNITREQHDPKLNYLIGTFKHSDGRRAVMLNNYRVAYTAWPTVEFDAGPHAVVEVDKWSGKEVPVVDASPDMEGLQISLDSGEGRLFLLP